MSIVKQHISPASAWVPQGPALVAARKRSQGRLAAVLCQAIHVQTLRVAAEAAALQWTLTGRAVATSDLHSARLAVAGDWKAGRGWCVLLVMFIISWLVVLFDGSLANSW